ncbi:MAG: AAA family ATPase [Ilumatobacteraceae bacterium]|nr:AAA family ATPase [Ilumatobacteraceae bacterium]
MTGEPDTDHRPAQAGPLLIVSGPPGAGKSTIGRLLADRMTPSALIEGDAFFRFLRNGLIEPWRVEARHQNEAIMQIQATTAAHYRTAGYETVYDGVVGPWFLDTFVAATGPFDYALLLPPVEVCLDRIGARRDHEFDDATATRSLHDQFTESCSDDLRRHVFDSAVGSPDEVADRIVATRQSGRLRIDQPT